MESLESLKIEIADSDFNLLLSLLSDSSKQGLLKRSSKIGNNAFVLYIDYSYIGLVNEELTDSLASKGLDADDEVTAFGERIEALINIFNPYKYSEPC
ncbi:MAG: hypothetical protein IPK79_13130 [Vampirovibrionales bacterium]|nr:hypothetical protein [Vampirovibrionales bacterium]